jgi:hypothetical protein
MHPQPFVDVLDHRQQFPSPKREARYREGTHPWAQKIRPIFKSGVAEGGGGPKKSSKCFDVRVDDLKSNIQVCEYDGWRGQKNQPSV